MIDVSILTISPSHFCIFEFFEKETDLSNFSPSISFSIHHYFDKFSDKKISMKIPKIFIK